MAPLHSLVLFGGAALAGPSGFVGGPASQPRRLALLALLALANPRAPIRRDRILAFLWPHAAPARARHLLSVSLHALRRTLGEQAIWSRGDVLGVDHGEIVVDAVEFTNALERGDDARVVELHVGPFLDGFFVSGVSAEFEQWVDHERKRFAAAYADALARLATAAEAAGDDSDALRLWTQLSAQDPASTRAALGAMRAQSKLGDTAAAVRAARTHAEFMRREFDAEPDAAISELMSQLSRGGKASLHVRRAARVRDTLAVDAVTILDYAASSPGADEWLGTAIAETLRQQLMPVPTIRVVGRDRLALALAERSRRPALVHRLGALEQPDVIALGKATDARWVVSGTYSSPQTATDIRVATRIVDVRSGERTSLPDLSGRLESLPATLGQLTTSLLSALELPAPAPTLRVSSRAETASLDAYEHCARAMQKLFEFTHESLSEAVHHLERAIALDPDYVAAHARIAGLYAHLHEASNDPRHLAAAAAAARAALERDPEDAYALMMLAYALWRSGDHAEAEKAARRAAEAAPTWHIAHLTLGTIRLAEGIEKNRIERCVAAVQPAARAALLEPDELLSQLNLPWLYMYFGQYALAREMLDNAVRAEDAGTSNFRHQGGYTLRAMLHRREREWAPAITLLERAVARYENGVHLTTPYWMSLTCCALGDIALQMQRLDDGVRWFRRAADVADARPRNLSIGFLRVRARLGLATAFARLVMTREAAAAFAEARILSVDPAAIDGLCRWEGSEALMHFDFARYHAAAGQRDDMAAELDAAVSLGWSDAPWLDSDVCFARFRDDAAVATARTAAAARAILPDYRLEFSRTDRGNRS